MVKRFRRRLPIVLGVTVQGCSSHTGFKLLNRSEIEELLKESKTGAKFRWVAKKGIFEITHSYQNCKYRIGDTVLWNPSSQVFEHWSPIELEALYEEVKENS